MRTQLQRHPRMSPKRRASRRRRSYASKPEPRRRSFAIFGRDISHSSIHRRTYGYWFTGRRSLRRSLLNSLQITLSHQRTAVWGYVAKWGRWGYYSRYEDLEVIVRLAGSECMRLFYEEIFRNDKGRYMYAANIEGEDADSRQDAAVIKLLDTVVKEAARAVIMPPTIVEAKQ